MCVSTNSHVDTVGGHSANQRHKLADVLGDHGTNSLVLSSTIFKHTSATEHDGTYPFDQYYVGAYEHDATNPFVRDDGRTCIGNDLPIIWR